MPFWPLSFNKVPSFPEFSGALIVKTKLVRSFATKIGNFLMPPYIVFLGDVGSGKCTVVEKLTGVKGARSRNFRQFQH